METILNTKFDKAITDTEVKIAEMAKKLTIAAYNSTGIVPNNFPSTVFWSCLASCGEPTG